MSDNPQYLNTSGGFIGSAWQLTGNGIFNSLTFLIDQAIAGRAFCGLVKVLSVTGGGASASPPFVNVQPMVNQVDGIGRQTPHGVVPNLPVFRLQGGSWAVVVDPAVGDIGAAIICHRDISTVKNTKAIAGPGSWRENDWADGLYFGSFLSAAPTTYVALSNGHISLVTPSASIIISGGTIATTGTLLNNGVNVGSTHVHSDPQGGNTGPPM